MRPARGSSRASPSGEKGTLDQAEQLVREAVRILLSVQERGKIVEAQRTLAEIVLAQGHVEEAERWAPSAVETVGMQDMMSRSNVRMVLGLVRAAQVAQRRRSSSSEPSTCWPRRTHRNGEPEPLAALAGFLREQGREEEAAEPRSGSTRSGRRGRRGSSSASARSMMHSPVVRARSWTGSSSSPPGGRWAGMDVLISISSTLEWARARPEVR